VSKKTDSCQVIEFSAERRGMAAFQDLKSGRHPMYALLEVDVTTPRRLIKDYRARTGEPLSFTGYLASCLAHAVEKDKTVQSYRKGSRKLVVPDDVDVGIMVELQQGEKRVLTGHVIKAANRKSLHEISQDIRSVQYSREPASAEKASWVFTALLLPWPLSRLFKALFRSAVRRDPTIATSMAGTVGISSVGMFGRGHSGWGIASGSHALDLVVGGTSAKVVEVEGRIERHEVMDLTIIFDHDVIDGAPAARFTRNLVEFIESGNGLTPSDSAEPAADYAAERRQDV
jgi:pyruvate/2-oxoglutarate dehydrogenase complex dihydrolipoamide acyltransferase (E2) component